MFVSIPASAWEAISDASDCTQSIKRFLFPPLRERRSLALGRYGGQLPVSIPASAWEAIADKDADPRVLAFLFPPLRERRWGGNMPPLFRCIVSIPASAWEAIAIRAKRERLHMFLFPPLRERRYAEKVCSKELIVSIPASAWEAIAKIYKIYCKIKLSNGSNVWVHEMNHTILNRFVVMYYQIVYFCLRQCSANICIGSIGAQDF